jgi:hypothetical protein
VLRRAAYSPIVVGAKQWVLVGQTKCCIAKGYQGGLAVRVFNRNVSLSSAFISTRPVVVGLGV